MTESAVPQHWYSRSIPTPLKALAAPCALLTGAAFAVAPVMGIGILLGVIYALVVIERPLIGVYTCFVLVPITAGVRRGLAVPGVKLDEALVLGTFILVAGFAGQTRRWGLVDKWLALFAFMAFALPIGSAILNGTPLTTLGIQKMGASILFVLLYRLARLAHFTDRQRWFAIKLLFAGTVPVVLIALGQRFDLPGVRDGVQTLTEGNVFVTWSYQQGAAATRATGPFENWHSLAGYLFPLFLLSVAIVSQRSISLAWRRFAAVMIAVTLVGIVAAQTITTLVVSVVAAVLVGSIQGRFARTVSSMLMVVMLAIVVSGGALTERVSTQFQGSGVGQNIETRLEIWTQDYAEPLRLYWETGYGPAVPPQIEWVHTESLYVTLLLRGGVLLVASYFILMFVIAALAWEGRHSTNPLDQVLSTALFATVVGSIAMHLVFPYLTSSGFPQVFWLLAALLTAGGADPEQSGARSPTHNSSARHDLASTALP